MPLDTCQTCPPDDDTCPPGPRASLGVRLLTLVAVLLPLAGLVMCIVLLWGVPFHWTYLAIFGGMYLLTALGIGVGYHRLFTHKSFETGAVMRFIWAVLGSMAVEGPVIRWVATHRKHHQHSDTPTDPHTPHGHGRGLFGWLKGYWHAHVGW